MFNILPQFGIPNNQGLLSQVPLTSQPVLPNNASRSLVPGNLPGQDVLSLGGGSASIGGSVYPGLYYGMPGLSQLGAGFGNQYSGIPMSAYYPGVSPFMNAPAYPYPQSFPFASNPFFPGVFPTMPVERNVYTVSDKHGFIPEIGSLFSEISSRVLIAGEIPQFHSVTERLFYDMIRLALGNGPAVLSDISSVANRTFHYGEVNRIQGVTGEYASFTLSANPLEPTGSNHTQLGNVIFASGRQREYLQQLATIIIDQGVTGIKTILSQIFPNISSSVLDAQARLMNQLITENNADLISEFDNTRAKIIAVEESLNTARTNVDSTFNAAQDRLGNIIQSLGS